MEDPDSSCVLPEYQTWMTLFIIREMWLMWLPQFPFRFAAEGFFSLSLPLSKSLLVCRYEERPPQALDRRCFQFREIEIEIEMCSRSCGQSPSPIFFYIQTRKLSLSSAKSTFLNFPALSPFSQIRAVSVLPFLIVDLYLTAAACIFFTRIYVMLPPNRFRVWNPRS